jgi:hypothetical protein
MNKLENRIETLANAAIIIAMLLSLGLGAYMFFPRGSSQPPDLKAGDKFPAAGIEWSKADQTIVLVLQKGCHFCAESAPFYKRLTAATAASVGIVAALPGERDEYQAYLDGLGVKVNEVIKINLGSLAIRGTPTLILVDNQGNITGVWAGKLGAEDEESILRKIS